MSTADSLGRGAALALAVAAALAAPACDRDAPAGGSVRAGSGSGSGQAKPEATSESRPPTADRRPSLVVLGDSLTAGFGLSAEQAVPALLQEAVDRAGLGMRVVNAGRSGDTTAGGKSRVDYYLRPEVAPRALVVWLGANDVMRGLPAAEIEANLRAIVERARQHDQGLRVFLVQMRAFPNMGADYTRQFEAIYPRVAESGGATLVPFPLEEVAGRPELNQSDGIHPNVDGTRRAAEALWRSLAPHLSAR
jgi:acyl-CoA thioesterase I